MASVELGPDVERVVAIVGEKERMLMGEELNDKHARNRTDDKDERQFEEASWFDRSPTTMPLFKWTKRPNRAISAKYGPTDPN